MSSFARVISEMLNENYQGQGSKSRMQGGMIAKVVDNVDPENRYRVRVSYPWLADQYTKDTTSDGSESKVQSFWARITTSMSGKGMGSFWLPEIDDEVFVQFEDGDFSRPIIVGTLWNGVNTVPDKIEYGPTDKNSENVANKDQNGKNDFRFFHSRMGHTITFIDRDGKGGISVRSKKSAELFIDDTDGSEKVELYDKNQSQWLQIDTKNKKITLQTDTGDILIKAKHKLTIQCENMDVKVDQNINITAGQKIEQKCTNYKAHSDANTHIDASANMKLTAARIDLNP
jgi:uncharacterized protein involved in type VI secretion and phage assembly